MGTRLDVFLPDPAGSLCPWKRGWKGREDREPEVEGMTGGSCAGGLRFPGGRW